MRVSFDYLVQLLDKHLPDSESPAREALYIEFSDDFKVESSVIKDATNKVIVMVDLNDKDEVVGIQLF